MTFREVAEDWYATKMIAEGKATTTLRRTRWLLDALNEDIGDRPIAEIEPALGAPDPKEDAGEGTL